MAYPLRWPGGPDQCAKDALDTITSLIHTQVGEDNVAAGIIEPIQGEGGFIVRRPGSCRGWRSSAPGTASCSSPTRSRAASAGPATGSAATTRVSCPTLVTTARHRRRAAACRGDRPGRDHGLGARRRPGRYLRRQPGSLRRRARRDRDDGGRGTWPGGPRRIGEIMVPRLRKLAGTYPVIADVRGRGAMIAIELAEPGHPTPRTPAPPGSWPGPATRPGSSCSPVARSATCSGSCRRWSSARTCWRRACPSWRTPSGRSVRNGDVAGSVGDRGSRGRTPNW